MGVSINGGTPIAGWFIRENPIYKWMMTGGTPISGNLHIAEDDHMQLVQPSCFSLACRVWVLAERPQVLRNLRALRLSQEAQFWTMRRWLGSWKNDFWQQILVNALRKAIFNSDLAPDIACPHLLPPRSQAWKLTVRCLSQQLATLADMIAGFPGGGGKHMNIYEHSMKITLKLWVGWYRGKSMLEVDQHFPTFFFWCFQWVIAESWWKPHGNNCFAVQELTEALRREGSCEAPAGLVEMQHAADMQLIRWLHVHGKHTQTQTHTHIITLYTLYTLYTLCTL